MPIEIGRLAPYFFHLLIKEQIEFFSCSVFCFPFPALYCNGLYSTNVNISEHYILKCNGRFNQTRLILCTTLMLFVEVYGVWFHVMKEIRKTKTFKISWGCWRGPLQWRAGEDHCSSPCFQIALFLFNFYNDSWISIFIFEMS